MLRDHESRVRGDDQTFRGNGAVGDITGILVEQRDRRHQLPNQAQCRVQVERQPPLRRDPQDLRQPRSLGMIRHDGEPAGLTIDAAHARVIGVPEVGQARRALPQGELERRDREQLRPQAENLQQVPRGAVDRDHASTETVGEKRRLGTLHGGGHPVHTIGRLQRRDHACHESGQQQQTSMAATLHACSTGGGTPRGVYRAVETITIW